MAINKIFITFFIALLFYFILDYFFNEMMMYVMGGVILGSLYELFNKKIELLPSLLVWGALLLFVIILFYRLRNKVLSYVLIVIIAALLYVIDFAVYDILPDDINGNWIIFVTVISKGVLLSIIIFGRNIVQVKKGSLSTKADRN